MTQKNEAIPTRTVIRTGIANFLQRHRMILISVILLALVVLAGLGIWIQIDNASRVDYAAKVEKIQDDYANWQMESDAAKKTAIASGLEKDLADIKLKAPISYGLEKAYFIEGNYFSIQKKYAEAAASFRAIFDKDPHSYLAPISLINSAVSWENAGNITSSLDTYALYLKSFLDNQVLTPQVLFSQGRILESQQKTKEAVASYKTLLEKFPDSSWTKLGRDRILSLGNV